ncbi:MAG: restriction endonuclease subunit S [Lentisphaerae bacterium]|nr:restriction endonuclease subunit S [Lentisphaerota bacterium]
MDKNSLRPGWKIIIFGDIAQNVAVRVDPSDAKTDVYVGLEHLDPSTLHLRQWGHPSDVTGQKLAFKKGDVIFGRRRAYQRKLAVAEFDGICSAHAMVVRAKPKMILPEFLPFFLQSDMFMERAIEISVGSLSPTINWKTMREQVFPLPPIDEQKRISEIMWAADEAVEKYVQVERSLVAQKQALIARHMPSDVPFRNLRKGIIPGISASKLKDVCSKITDGTHQSPPFSKKGIPFLLISNVSHGEVDWNVSKWITEETYAQLTKKTKPEVGDVLYTVVASYGDAVLIDWDHPFSFQRHIAIIKPNHDRLDGKFLCHFLKSVLGRKQAEIYAEGLAQKTITLRSLGQFCVPTPPIHVQKAICAELDFIDQSISKSQEALVCCRALSEKARNELITGAPHV